jgi:hypothetical protein
MSSYLIYWTVSEKESNEIFILCISVGYIRKASKFVVNVYRIPNSRGTINIILGRFRTVSFAQFAKWRR